MSSKLMISQNATAYLSGYLLLRDTDASEIDLESRKRLKTALTNFVSMSNGACNIYVRWTIDNVDTASAEMLWREAQNQWYSRQRSSFPLLLTFLRGYFHVSQKNTVSVVALPILVSELERVDDDLPMRYQRLFFELMLIVQKYASGNVDLTALKNAIDVNSEQFAAVSLQNVTDGVERPDDEQTTADDTTSEKSSKSNADADSNAAIDRGTEGVVV